MSRSWAREVVELLRSLLWLPDGASDYALEVDALHFFIFGTTLVGATAIFGFTAWALFRYGQRMPSAPSPYHRAPPWLEALLIGGLLVLFCTWWVIGYRSWIGMQVAPEEAIDVYVTGKQWMFKFVYPDGRRSAGVLVVPKGQPVRLVMTSRDVIHSFYVPAFRLKRDLVPGRYTTAWFRAEQEGTYLLQCAEFCGFDHSRMDGWVVVVDAETWGRWADRGDEREVASSPAPLPGVPPESDLTEMGRTVAVDKGCLNCHTVDGSPHIGPTFHGLYRREVRLRSGEVITADVRYLTESMVDPGARVVAGFDPVMPSYQGQLEAWETAALVAWIRSLEDEEEP